MFYYKGIEYHERRSDFFQMWQCYQLAINNPNIARQVNCMSKFGVGRPLYLIVDIARLDELKQTTSLEF